MKPRWDCRNDADRERLERWTHDQLNDDPPSWRELPTNCGANGAN
jgi:hypothetical protein